MVDILTIRAMFKKPLAHAGNATQLKSSDRRNLQKAFSELHGISLDEAKRLLPDSLKQSKASTASEHLTLFSDDDGPVAFRLGKGDQGQLVPTLYTIWSSSNNLSLPILITNDMVLEKLAGGADLFAQGIASFSFDALSDVLVEGSLIGIATMSIPGAVRAVGRLARSSKALKSNREGKAVEVLHVEGDSLWEQGKKLRAQPRDVPTTEEPAEDRQEGTSASAAEASQDAFSSETIQDSLSQADVDLVLHEALLYAISQILAKQPGAFPISSSKFMDTYVFPSRWASSVEHEVSIKKSSYKNASAFLKQAKKDGLIGTKEAKGGEVSVVSVNGTHPDVKAFKPYKTVAQLQKQEKKREIREDQAVASASQRQVDVVQLYKPHVQSIDLCSELGFEKDSLVGATKLRDAVNTYITDNKLVNDHDHGYINLNDALAGALLKKGEQVDFLPRSEVLDRLLKAMQPWYSSALSQEGKKEETIHKGLLPKVSICVKKRQGKKLVTIIEGIEPYLIPHQKLAEDLQVKCASSATTNEVQGSSAKKPMFEVVVQGSQIPIVTKELTETWGVAKNCLNVTKA